MRHGAVAQWVNKCLSKRTLRKSAIFCFILFLVIVNGFGVKDVQAANPELFTYPGKTLIVTAIVPLTQEFAYLIRKNSSISLEKEASILGEVGEVIVRIQGGESKPLKDHAIELRIFNIHSEEVIFVSGKTDALGVASFYVIFDEQFLGENVIRVIDTTYGVPLSLAQELTFIVYETQDAREQAIKDAAKNQVGTAPVVVAGASVESAVLENIYHSDKNVIMGARFSFEANTRAGPI